MKVETARLCVYPKDVQRITGKSERWLHMLLVKIRKSLNKEEHQFISIEKFCKYTGFNIDQVNAVLIV